MRLDTLPTGSLGSDCFKLQNTAALWEITVVNFTYAPYLHQSSMLGLLLLQSSASSKYAHYTRNQRLTLMQRAIRLSESIGITYSTQINTKICQELQREPNNIKMYLGHLVGVSSSHMNVDYRLEWLPGARRNGSGFTKHARLWQRLTITNV